MVFFMAVFGLWVFLGVEFVLVGDFRFVLKGFRVFGRVYRRSVKFRIGKKNKFVR